MARDVIDSLQLSCFVPVSLWESDPLLKHALTLKKQHDEIEKVAASRWSKTNKAEEQVECLKALDPEIHKSAPRDWMNFSVLNSDPKRVLKRNTTKNKIERAFVIFSARLFCNS